MVLILRMGEVKQPTSHPARARLSRHFGARHNAALDSDRMSMTIHPPMRQVVTTTCKQEKAGVEAVETCLQMSTQHSPRSNSDEKV